MILVEGGLSGQEGWPIAELGSCEGNGGVGHPLFISKARQHN
jgi:hypothetical protein